MTETNPDGGRTQSEIEMDDDVEWIALRYVLDELTPPEQERFEALLERDSNARDAVERAVDLTHALRGESASPRVSERRSPWGSLSIGVAAAALVAVAVALQLRNSPPSSSVDAEQLIECWVALGEDLEEVDIDSFEEDATSDPWAADEESQDEFPDWLWTAIEGEDR